MQDIENQKIFLPRESNDSLGSDDLESFKRSVFGGDFEAKAKNYETEKEVTKMAKDEKTEKSKPLRKDRILCVKCGGAFAQRPDVREKRIAKFGSAGKLEANYLCRECRKGKEFDGSKWVAEQKKEKPVKAKAVKKK